MLLIMLWYLLEAVLSVLILVGGTYLVYIAGKAVRMAYTAIHPKN